MSKKFQKCDVDLTRFLISYLEKRRTKTGEPFKWAPPNPLHPWYEAFSRLRKSKKVDSEYLAGMIRWAFEKSGFWHTVIRSPDNIKKNFDKIQAQMEAPKAMTTFEKKRSAVDDYQYETSDIVSRGTLPNDQFTFGMKILLSCGGPNIDTQTLAVWYKMLSDLKPRYFSLAIEQICKEEESIATLNIVQKIRESHDHFQRQHRRSLNQKKLLSHVEEQKKFPERFGCPEETRKQIRLLTKRIG